MKTIKIDSYRKALFIKGSLYNKLCKIIIICLYNRSYWVIHSLKLKHRKRARRKRIDFLFFIFSKEIIHYKEIKQKNFIENIFKLKNFSLWWKLFKHDFNFSNWVLKLIHFHWCKFLMNTFFFEILFSILMTKNTFMRSSPSTWQILVIFFWLWFLIYSITYQSQ